MTGSWRIGEQEATRFGQIWTVIRRVGIGVGVALSFFAVVELIRAYEVLRDLHPVLGSVFVWTLVLGLAGLLVYYRLVVYRWRSVLMPPPAQDVTTAGEGALQGYLRYLRRVIQRLSQNELLPEDRRETLRREAQRLQELSAARPGRDVLAQAVSATEIEVIEPTIGLLDALAEKEVRACVRDVMVAVTLSPWRSVDLLVVLYRNTAMVARITRQYESRPRFREQMAILRDVAAIVATVNFLNYGSRLLQNMATSVLPFMGRFTDDIAQGVGAGLLTSVAGHATIDRCRAFRGWNQAEAEETVRRKLKDFAADLKDLVTTDLFSKIRKPVESRIPEGEAKPELLVRVKEGVATALDETAAVMDTFVRRPVTVAGRGMVNGGSWVGDAVRSTARRGVREAVKAAKVSGHVAGVAATHAGRTIRKGAVVGADLAKQGTAAAVRGTRAGAVRAAQVARRLTKKKPEAPQNVEPRSAEPKDEEPDV